MSARPDPDAFANLLCEWCLDARPEQQVPCRSPVHGLPLVRALHAAVLERDAWPLIRITPDGIGEAFYRHARERHLDAFAPLELLETQTADAVLGIDAPANTREFAGVDPELIARAARARQPVQEACLSKRWCGTLWPTAALAQQAGMSDGEYAAFVTRAAVSRSARSAQSVEGAERGAGPHHRASECGPRDPWDLICDLRGGGRLAADGHIVNENGRFVE